MTDTSTWLESSRMLGSGSRVLIKFEPDMKVRGAPPSSGGIGLFPGCLVGLRGRNGGGKLFAAHEILMVSQPLRDRLSLADADLHIDAAYRRFILTTVGDSRLAAWRGSKEAGW